MKAEEELIKSLNRKIAENERRAAEVVKRLQSYFEYWGASHEGEDCPEDDTCSCKLVQGINRAFDLLNEMCHKP